MVPSEILMNTKTLIELFGYLGSLLVVVSMLMTSVKKLRIVNTVGSTIFMIYALIIQSYPTALMNLCLIIINIYRIIQLDRTERHFHLVKGEVDAEPVGYLLDYYADDIKKYFPDAKQRIRSGCDTAFLVVCDATPAGIMAGNRTDDDTVDMIIDYALPAYRDCSVGTFLYSHLAEYDIKTLTFSGRSEGHDAYMKKMGFIQSEGKYIKQIK